MSGSEECLPILKLLNSLGYLKSKTTSNFSTFITQQFPISENNRIKIISYLLADEVLFGRFSIDMFKYKMTETIDKIFASTTWQPQTELVNYLIEAGKTADLQRLMQRSDIKFTVEEIKPSLEYINRTRLRVKLFYASWK